MSHTCKDVPGTHLLIEASDVVGKLLAGCLHLINVDLLPRRRLPVIDATSHNICNNKIIELSPRVCDICIKRHINNNQR